MTEALLIELLTEELPPHSLKSLGQVFAQQWQQQLEQAGVLAAQCTVASFASPRRLAVVLSQVSGHEPDQTLIRKGPYVAGSVDDTGQALRALSGFMAANAINAIADLEQLSDAKGPYWCTTSRRSGRPLLEVVEQAFEGVLKALPVAKMMRWGEHRFHFVRPVQSLVVMWGAEVLPVRLFNLSSGAVISGHRNFGAARPLAHANVYAESLAELGVIASFEQRLALIQSQVERLAASLEAEVVADLALLEEITALVEAPHAVLAEFDPTFLAVPEPCLVLSMQRHQKYLPLKINGRLSQHFIVIANLPQPSATALANIRAGNQRVLKARLSDARFFYEEDLKHSPTERASKLGEVVFLSELGSLADRTERLVKLAAALAQQVDQAQLAEAASLCKSDLLSHMVGEFAELQGVMGGVYAAHAGHSAAVATAIGEHYRPAFATDQLPSTPLAQALALIDRLDLLVGLFALDLSPSGDKDIFGLRRAALALLRLAEASAWPLALEPLIAEAGKAFPTRWNAERQDKLLAFIWERARHFELWKQRYPAAVIQAVLASPPASVVLAVERLEALHRLSVEQAEQLATLSALAKRIRNLFKGLEFTPSEDYSLLQSPVEQALLQQWHQLEQQWPQVSSAYEQWLLLLPLGTAVAQLFEHHKVMDDQLELRQQRLSLLAAIGNKLNHHGDLSALGGR